MRHDGDDESLRLLRCGVAVSSFYSESDSKVESTKRKSGASGQRQCTIRQFGERFPPDSTVRLVDGRSVGRLQVAYATAMFDWATMPLNLTKHGINKKTHLFCAPRQLAALLEMGEGVAGAVPAAFLSSS